MSRKLVLFGVDGADWEVLDPLIKEGCLPNFKRAMDKGTRAHLRSTIPPLTAPAWTSIFTGVNPGKHGIFDFGTVVNGKPRYTSGADRQAPYFWELMHREKVLAFNIPMSFPPRTSANAMLITGFGTPDRDSAFTAPAGLRTEILGIVPDYDFDMGPEGQLVKMGASADKSGIVRTLKKGLDSRMKVARHLLKSKEWDAAFMVFSETDWVQHYFMSEFLNADKKSGTEIAEIYKMLDPLLGELLDSGCDVLIASDHGFREIRRIFFMNTYFVKNGVLKLKKATRRGAMHAAGLTRERVLSFIPLQLYDFIRRSRLLANLGRSVFPSDVVGGGAIDYPGSVFLSSRNGGIMVPAGHDRKHVAQLVKAASDEEGSAVVRDVYARESLYSGPHVEKAPPLTAVPEHDVHFSCSGARTLGKKVDSAREMNGAHRELGVFVSCGPNLRALGRLDTLHLLDIAPTVLSYFGYAVPEALDGKPVPVISGKSAKGSDLRYRTLLSIGRLARKGR
ncbi:MAG: alkaline phosphatase family protein [Candidatus Micrarchaeota archaeon]